MNDEFRCAVASAEDQEPIAGTAPTDESWLFLEYAGAWGNKAVAESRMPVEVRDHLEGLRGVRVQLIRRYAGASGPGVRLFRARLGESPTVETATLTDVREVLDAPTWTAYDEPLLLVCTNGSRDRCCAEYGRPIAARLAQRWPASTWETTHLGGHRFAGTLLALPSGIALGRLNPDTAITACEELLGGGHPLESSRGRAGLPEAAQVAELHLRGALGLRRQPEVRLVDSTDRGWVFDTHGQPPASYVVRVTAHVGEARKQSCGPKPAKPTTKFVVTAVEAPGEDAG